MPNEWQSVLDEIKNNVSDMAYATYFNDLKLISNNDGELTIAAKSVFVKAQLESKYKKAILNSIEVIGAHDFEVIVKSDENTVKRGINRTIEVIPEDMRRPVAQINTPTASPISKAPTPAFSRTPSTGSTINYGNTARFKTTETNLNAKYTFDNYIIGNNNDLAVNAARAVVEAPGTRYNPYFIYGGPGLGKTHLIQAIGNELRATYPNYKVLYVTIEQFYHDFVESMRHKIGGFAEKYRNLDCLIVDDFQFIVGKEKSQDEFFHTFNELHQNNKQIIVSSDRLPNQIATVDERLSSRLMMGMGIDIQFPDFETRCAIIKAKAELLRADLDNKTVEYIADSVRNNIRDLEGKLNQILAMAELRGVSPSEIIDGFSMQAPTETFANPKRNIQPKQVIEKVAKYYDLSAKDLLGTSRVKNIKTARQIAMYLMNEELDLSTVRIGNEFGKDHTTIMHGIKVIKTNLKTDFTLREQITELRQSIYGS